MGSGVGSINFEQNVGFVAQFTHKRVAAEMFCDHLFMGSYFTSLIQMLEWSLKGQMK